MAQTWSGFLTRQRSEGEMLRLAAFSLAVDDVEVHFDRMTHRCVPVRRHFHKQHALQSNAWLLPLTALFKYVTKSTMCFR